MSQWIAGQARNDEGSANYVMLYLMQRFTPMCTLSQCNNSFSV